MLDGVRNAALFGLLVINLSGCVGYYQTKSSVPVEKDLTLALLVVPQNERKLWKKEKAQLATGAKFINDERALPLATIPIGQKDLKSDSITKEIMVYNDKKRWCGRTVWAIIPIPLLTQSCRTFTELTIENGEPMSAREQYLEKTGHICGPFVPMFRDSNATTQQGFCEEIGGIE